MISLDETDNEMKMVQNGTVSARPRWVSVSKQAPPREEPQWMGDIPVLDSILSPANYFKFFFDDNLMEHIVHMLKEKRNRCKFPGCKGYPSIFCTKKRNTFVP